MDDKVEEARAEWERKYDAWAAIHDAPLTDSPLERAQAEKKAEVERDVAWLAYRDACGEAGVTP